MRAMNPAHHEAAVGLRARLSTGPLSPVVFRRALERVPVSERDAWIDVVIGIDEVPEDGPDLPRGCAPYLPCPVDRVLRAIDGAGVTEHDVFIDVGSGVGRAAAVTHFLTGAGAIGIEIQSGLVHASRQLADRLRASRVRVVEGDAARLTSYLVIGTVFFLYCPFGGARLARVLRDIESIARTHEVRVCAIDLPFPVCSWLTPLTPADADVAVYRSSSPTRVGASWRPPSSVGAIERA